MFYKVDFRCSDKDELQQTLNSLYAYRDDIETKVAHRNRMNLFYLLMQRLLERKVITSFGSAIDIGCNSGAYSRMLSDFGFEHVLGIDIDGELVQRANDFFAFRTGGKTLEYKILDVEKMETAKKYDFVLCTEVIEHTRNPSEVIQKVKDILAPGGVAVVTLPNRISIGYLTLVVSAKAKKKELDELHRRHLDYPFYRSVRLFRDKHLRLIQTSGTHLILSGKALRLLYRTPVFGAVNWMDFHLSGQLPFKYFTQFFFMVLKREVS